MKTERQTAILDLLVKASVNARIANQDDLRRKLASRGFHVTQATLSRDIHELALSKGPGGYSLPNGATVYDDSLPAMQEVLKNFGIEVRQAQNLLVLVTTTGGAQPVAATVDYEEYPEVVGTIAGDDTVLIICLDAVHAATLKLRIEAYIA